MQQTKLPKKVFAHYKKPLIPFPNLIETQTTSYKWLVEKGLAEVFKEFSPINDYSSKKFQLEFSSFSLGEPKYDEYHAKTNKLTYETQLKARVRLTNKTMGTTKEQEMFLADLPMMTNHGTFVINGVERVIVPQLARSYGVFFTEQESKGKNYFGTKIIPARGVWIEVETDPDGAIYVRVDKKRKFAITSLMRILGLKTDAEILKYFKSDLEQETIKLCLAKDPAKSVNDSYIEIYKRLRDGELATAENAKEFVNNIFSVERYDLSSVGRFRFNNRFTKKMEEKGKERRTISADDIATIATNRRRRTNDSATRAWAGSGLPWRPVRCVGELLQ